jgi:serine/threonine-protein kinase
MESDVLIGDHIGAYRVTGGGGDRGYTAAHRHTGQRVQVFVARAEVGGALDLFQRARMYEALPHPGFARIVDRGVLVDHRSWLAIDVPKGLPLFDLVARRPLPSSEAAQLVHDVADVLAFAHERGIQHRNLTLRSIVITTGTRAFPVAVVDFGFPGTTDDIVALGTIAYRAITQLFPATVVEDVPGAAPELAELIARMLAKEPADRPTAAAIRDAVAQLLAPSVEEPVVTTARWTQPRWTPAPPITSDLRAMVSGEIADKTEKV